MRNHYYEYVKKYMCLLSLHKFLHLTLYNKPWAILLWVDFLLGFGLYYFKFILIYSCIHMYNYLLGFIYKCNKNLINNGPSGILEILFIVFDPRRNTVYNRNWLILTSGLFVTTLDQHQRQKSLYSHLAPLWRIFFRNRTNSSS